MGWGVVCLVNIKKLIHHPLRVILVRGEVSDFVSVGPVRPSI